MVWSLLNIHLAHPGFLLDTNLKLASKGETTPRASSWLWATLLTEEARFVSYSPDKTSV